MKKNSKEAVKEKQLESREPWADEIRMLRDESTGFKLYLGTRYDAKNLKQLRAHGVTYILNVSDDVPNYHENDPESGLVYKKLNVADFGADPGISRVFDDAIAFVEEAMAKPTNVIVHCAHGSNRSPAIVVALAMYLKKVPLSVANEAVCKDRKHVYMMSDNLKELVAYEKKLRGKNSVKIERFRFVPLVDDEV